MPSLQRPNVPRPHRSQHVTPREASFPEATWKPPWGSRVLSEQSGSSRPEWGLGSSSPADRCPSALGCGSASSPAGPPRHGAQRTGGQANLAAGRSGLGDPGKPHRGLPPPWDRRQLQTSPFPLECVSPPRRRALRAPTARPNCTGWATSPLCQHRAGLRQAKSPALTRTRRCRQQGSGWGTCPDRLRAQVPVLAGCPAAWGHAVTPGGPSGGRRRQHHVRGHRWPPLPTQHNPSVPLVPLLLASTQAKLGSSQLPGGEQSPHRLQAPSHLLGVSLILSTHLKRPGSLPGAPDDHHIPETSCPLERQMGIAGMFAPSESRF